jgi:uncharacterized protein HemY
MLGGASPYGASGRDTSQLREIMDKTADRIGTDLKDQPEAEADLRSTLGQTYFTLLDYVKAEQMQRAALEIYRKLGADDNTLAIGTLRLGQTLRETTKLSEAETLCRESVEITVESPETKASNEFRPRDRKRVDHSRQAGRGRSRDPPRSTCG